MRRRVYVTVGRPSVRLSVTSIDSSNGGRLVCCWAPRGQKISTDSCGRRAAGAGAQQQMRVASRYAMSRRRRLNRLTQTCLSVRSPILRWHKRNFTPFLTAERSVVMSVFIYQFVCLSVYPRAYLRNYMSELKFLCLLHMSVARSFSGGFALYITYFRFYWRVMTSYLHIMSHFLAYRSILLQQVTSLRRRAHAIA